MHYEILILLWGVRKIVIREILLENIMKPVFDLIFSSTRHQVWDFTPFRTFHLVHLYKKFVLFFSKLFVTYRWVQFIYIPFSALFWAPVFHFKRYFFPIVWVLLEELLYLVILHISPRITLFINFHHSSVSLFALRNISIIHEFWDFIPIQAKFFCIKDKLFCFFICP